ncbi:MAG: transporter substrate-binding domain-containing protein [Spirochaetaceae bacterium]|nr:transporter substrate-binding domain-containing protein [Spirochaetaceae bacterium]
MKKLLTVVCLILIAATLFAGGKKEKVVINSAADLEGRKIGVQTGTTGELYATEEIKNAKVVGFKTGMDAALDLKNGAIDLIVLDELPAKEIVKRNADLMIVDLDLAIEEYAIAIKKGNTDLLNSINATIATMKANGDYEKLVNAFMPVDGNITIPAEIVSNGTEIVKLGTNAAFPPFEYVEGSDIVGFDITMGQRIAADYGKKLEVVNMEFDSLIPALSSGAIDFIAAGMSVTEERKKNVDFSEAYYASKQVVIVRK